MLARCNKSRDKDSTVSRFVNRRMVLEEKGKKQRAERVSSGFIERRKKRKEKKEKKQLPFQPSVCDCLRFSRAIGGEWLGVHRSIARTICSSASRADPFSMEAT